MTRDFDMVLDEAISRVEAGEAVEECLASYPEHAGLLAPLLRMAAFSERALADVEPLSEIAAAAGKQRFLAAAAQQRLLAAAAAQQVPAAPQRMPAPRPRKRLRLFALPARRLAAAALTLLLLVILGGGLAAVSADSLPGDLLYPVKLATEQVRLLLTVDGQAREELLIGFGDERRAEAAAVLESGREVRIAFEGTLESIDESLWTIGGLQVTLDEDTLIVGDPFVGATVAVEGLALGDGSLLAVRLTVKGAGEMPGRSVTPLPVMTLQPTITPLPSRSTRRPSPTDVQELGPTHTSCPTETHEPEPTCTSYPMKTCEPQPTQTSCPTKTHEPELTRTPCLTKTQEQEPTQPPQPTATHAPEPTLPTQPTATRKPKPTHMSHPTKSSHH